MSEILIRFIQGTAWDSRLVEWRTNAWCSHCEIVLEGERTLGAMLDGGVQIREFADPVYRDVKRREIWRLPSTEDQLRDFHAFAVSQIGKPYDWREIVRLGISNALFRKRNWSDPDSWICSEYAAACVQRSGRICLADQMPSNQITPELFYGIVSSQPGARK